MDLAEVLLVSRRRTEAVPGVDDALRESKEAPPAARARARIEELAPSVAADAWSRRQPQ